MENNYFNIKQIQEILNIPSPTGYTTDMLNYIKNELNNINIDYKISNKGALLANIEGKNVNKSITFAAHIDTLGAMISKIKPNSRLAITQIGEYIMNSVEGENLIIHTRDGKKYEGTLQTIKPSIHIDGKDAKYLKRDCENYEIVIDEQINNPQDIYNLGINVGDIVSFDTRTRVTKSGFIKSRYLDNKASVSAILNVIRYIKLNNIFSYIF